MVLQYLPLQTRARHRRSHRPHVPMLMRGTPSTMRSPPHQSRQACVPHRTSHPPAKGRSPQLRPCTGKVASAGAGQLRRATRPAAGHARVPPPTPPAPPPQPHTTRPPPTTTRPEERRTSCRQQPAPPPLDAAKMSPRISIGPEPVYLSVSRHPTVCFKLCLENIFDQIIYMVPNEISFALSIIAQII
jgi:hypothetical protein